VTWKGSELSKLRDNNCIVYDNNCVVHYSVMCRTDGSPIAAYSIVYSVESSTVVCCTLRPPRVSIRMSKGLKVVFATTT
jgi:hypothetical protein